jgi:hypothetical protein
MAEPFDPDALPPDAQVAVTRDGKRGTIPRAELEDYQRHGWQLEAPEATKDARLQNEYGDQGGQAALEGAARTLTFGLSDVALSQLDPEGAREREQRNPGYALAGELGGALLGGGIGMGGAVTAAGEAAGAGVAEAAGGGLGARLLGGAARGAVEGAAYGAGTGIGQVALDPQPLTWEGAAATIGSNVLGGAVVGAGVGVGGKLLEEGAGAARSYANAQVEKLAAPDAVVDRSAFPEIATLDKPAAREAIAAEREAVKTQRATDLVEGKAARETELANLGKAKDAEAAALHNDALAYKDYLREDPSAFIPTADKETASILKRSKLQIMKGLDNAEGFVEKRGSAAVLDGLQKQKGALGAVLADADEVIAGAGAERQAMLDALPKPGAAAAEAAPAAAAPRQTWSEFTRGKMGPYMASEGGHAGAMKRLGEEWTAYKAGGELPGAAEAAAPGSFYLTPEQSKLYASYAGVEMPAGQKALAIGAEDLAGFRSAIESGQVNPPNLQRVIDAQALLQKNQELLDKFAALKAPPTSAALEAIDAKLDAVRAGVQKTPRLEALEAHLADLSDAEQPLLRKIARHVVGTAGGAAGFHVGGMVGAMTGHEAGAELGGRLYDRLVRKIQLGNAMRAKSISASVAQLFAKTGEKAGLAARRAAPLASKILPSIQYAQRDVVDGVLGPAHAAPGSSKLVDHFRERARELNALTEKQPDGSFGMRMGARQALNARMQALWAVAPEVANGVEKTHAARVAFLASKLPRNPAPPHLQVGPDTWEPSHAELAKFARYMEAVEQPERIVQRMAVGTMTPEDADVLKSVYPGMYEDTRQQLMTHLAEARAMPYQKRLALSIYLDVAADPAVTPEAITVYQGLYAQQQAQQPVGGAPPGPPPKAFKTSEKPTRAQTQGV